MKYLVIAVVAIMAFTACKKNDTGGNVVISAYPEHHNSPIKGATVYIKFGAEELPADPMNDYDLKISAANDEEHVHIEGLRYGTYFFYAVGYDSAVSAQVTGGVAVKIKWKERAADLSVDIPVVE